MGQIICEVQNEDDILSLEQDNYWELMDQLHPLRGAEMADVFPVLHYFKNDDNDKMNNAKINEEELFD